MTNQVKQTGVITQSQKQNSVDKKPQTIKDYIVAMQGAVKKALPAVMTPERFTRIALSAVSNTPELGNCTPNSFLAALMNAAQLGLEPNTPLGQAYLIPFKNNKKGIMECQFQIGYKGLIDLAYRSGEVKTIQAQIVFENDDFDFEFGLEPKLKHKPAKENRGAAIWVYAVFKLVNGGEGFEVMSMDDIRVHAKRYSQSFNSAYSPWTSNFEEMAKKTVIKKVLKYAPLKSDFVRGITEDETIKHDISDDMSAIHADYIVVEPETGEVIDEHREARDPSVMEGQISIDDTVTA